MATRESWTDEEILRALDLKAHDGLSNGQIAKALGRPRNAVIGVFHRITRDHENDSRRLSPRYRDGALPRGWWAAGIAKRPIDDATAEKVIARIRARKK